MTEAWLKAWEARGELARAVPCGAGELLVLERGARAFPLDDRGDPLLWVAPGLSAGAATPVPLSSRDWNTGGERLWVGPEIRFMIHDRRDFDGSYELPLGMDPGVWRLAAEAAGSVRLNQAVDLVAYDTGERVSLEVEQRLAPAADPLRRQAASSGAKHMGWTREVRLERSRDDAGEVACQAWLVTQVMPGGTAWVPGAGGARLTDYFEPVDPDHLRRVGPHVSLSLDGARRFKVGVRTGEHNGELLYWREMTGAAAGPAGGGRAELILRRSLDVPSSRYLEQPPASAEHEGDSLYVYNDGGRNGGFGELESLGRALEPDGAAVTDLFETHVWWGSRTDVIEVAHYWLGDEWAPGRLG